MEKTKKCVMCGQPAEFIDKETKELLCRKCAVENERIHKSKGR